MNSFCTLFLVAAFASGDDVLPPIRLDTGGPVALAQVSRDGNNVFAVVKDGERYSFVAWEISRKSKTILRREPTLQTSCCRQMAGPRSASSARSVRTILAMRNTASGTWLPSRSPERLN